MTIPETLKMKTKYTIICKQEQTVVKSDGTKHKVSKITKVEVVK